MDSEPTETTGRTITVKLFGRHGVETEVADSIADAISRVKAAADPEEAKIVQNDEVVYAAERNGTIEDWEREYEREKRRLSAEASTWDCPHGSDYCYEDDRCLDCQLDRASGRVDD